MSVKQSRVKVLHFAKLVSRNDFVDSVVCNLNPNVFEVYVVTFQDVSLTSTPLFKERNIFHINLNVANARNFTKLVPLLNRIIKDNSIQLVHSHLFEEAIISGFLKIANPKVRFVIGRHYSDETYLLHNGFKRYFWLGAESFGNTMADAIIAGSQMVRDILLKQKVKPGKIASIPYGFDFNDFRYKKLLPTEIKELKTRFGVSEDDLLLVNVGRLFQLKGQHLLIDVFSDLCRKHLNLKLLIIGDGPDRIMLQEKVKALGLTNSIIFTGWLKDAHKLISASDIVVHPTLSEMFSQLMIESMALGKPLIINNVSGVRDVITSGFNGVICEHKYEDWFKALDSLIIDDKGRVQLGVNAELHVKDTYPIEKVIKMYEGLYIKLLN